MKSKNPDLKKPVNYKNWGVVLSVVSFALVSLFLLTNTFAAPKNSSRTISMYLTPSGSQLAVGQIFPVAVRVNTLTKVTNAVQADVKFNPTYIEYVSYDDSGSSFDIAAQTTASTGLLQIVRASTAGISGDQLLTTVRFKALIPGNKVQVGFNSTSQILTQDNQTNILQKLIGGTYNIR